MIESRYTIEYINPDSTEKPKANKIFALYAFLGLIVILILSYIFFSKNQSNDFVRVPNKIQDQTLKIADTNKEKAETTTSPNIANKATPPSTITTQQNINKLPLKEKQAVSKLNNQLENNKKLSQSINNLTAQLMAEREKNKSLDKKLNSQENTNQQLSKLLEKASSTDKNYLNALETINDSKNIVIDKSKRVEPNIQVIANNIEAPNKASNFNAVSLSTNSQVDAIIAAMQSTTKNTSKIIKTNIDKTKEIQLASVSVTTPTELLHIQLQQQIDQILFTKNGINTKINNAYKKALEKESNIHQNSLRSITIEKGETLWAIAKRAYGSGALYKKIIVANPQANLEKLFVGQVIRVPK